jgi:two-component system, LytTR family, sensor kinase
MSEVRHPRARFWALGALVWTVLALMSAAQNAAWRAHVGRSVDWSSLLPYALADWYTCGMFTPAFYWMARRFPIRGEHWWSCLPVHLAGSLGFVVLKVTAFTPLLQLLEPEGGTWSDVFFDGFYADLLAYWAAIGVIHAIEYYRESRARELEAARLDGALREAELENLTAQLQPHFLFNTLQSISTLIHRDQAGADRMLTNLSELLRLSLRHTAAQEVPLREELIFLGRYLDIMRTRFGDRLAIDLTTDPEVEDALVPSLLLQPIVENAIRHGMEGRSDRGHVRVKAARDGASLCLEVTDDGPGSTPLSAPGTGGGIGLTNTRERLARLYGSAATIESSRQNGRGMTVRLILPFRLKTDG